MNHPHIPLLIIGGGIGGLATALGAAMKGRSVTVLEQSPEFGEVGAGIQLAPNATAVLHRLGVMDEINEVAVFPKRLVLKSALKGNELSALDLGESFRAHFGHPYIVLHRSDLQNALLNACRRNERITLLTNKSVLSVESIGEYAEVRCSDGTAYQAKGVVGADGLWSKSRKLFSDDEPICSHYVAYRGTLPMSEMEAYSDLDDVIMWIGPHQHLVQYPVRKKELYNQVVVFKSNRYKPDSDDWGTPEELDEHFGPTCEPVRHAVSFISKQRRWPMYDREALPNWTKGRVTLLGDAAHPMLQYMAQGGCQALEDAAALANALAAHGDDVEQAFQAYQAERLPRANKVQKNARLWGQFLHTNDPMALLMRQAIFDKRDPKDLYAIDWLYGQRY